jgi:hypothetical protein
MASPASCYGDGNAEVPMSTVTFEIFTDYI